MSTSSGNVPSIDEGRSAAEATSIADNNAEPVYHNNCVNQYFEHKPEDNNSVSGPPVDASDLHVEDTERAPTSSMQHPDTTGTLDDTIINSDDINIRTPNNATSNEPDTHDCEDPKKRVLTNPMYEELPDISTQQADNVSNEHDLQGPSNTKDSKGEKKIKKLQSQPNLKSLQPNAMYGGANIPNKRAGDDSPIYRYCYLIALVIFLVMVGLITAGIMVGVYHDTQDHGNPTVPPMQFKQGSTNWSTTFKVMTEPDDTTPPLLGTTNGKFIYVSGLAVSSTNELFVADNWNYRIQVFNMKGDFLRSFDTGKDMRPRDIAMDQDDTLWVLLIHVGNGNRCVKQYSREGKILSRPACKLRHVKCIALDTLSDKIVIAKRKTSGKVMTAGWFDKHSCTVKPFDETELTWPAYAAVDKKGNIFITGNATNHVYKYDKNGKYICRFGRKGDGVGNHLKSPIGICVDSLGRIIVADKDNNRVEMFTAEGEYIRTIANISCPQRVAIGREGQLISSGTGLLFVWKVFSTRDRTVICVESVQHQGQDCYLCGKYSAPGTGLLVVWKVFSTRDRTVICVESVQHQGQDCYLCGKYSAPGTGLLFVWKVFSTRDRTVICVESVQHQGQDCYLCRKYSAPGTGLLFVWKVFSTRDRTVICVESVQHQGQDC
ncbi:hypothetical protein Bbelb_192180 [Branchiostoma belcheri]|nr:hypothetical protein Bbelb_192180 [Branchiostoma belcheri]